MVESCATPQVITLRTRCDFGIRSTYRGAGETLLKPTRASWNEPRCPTPFGGAPNRPPQVPAGSGSRTARERGAPGHGRLATKQTAPSLSLSFSPLVIAVPARGVTPVCFFQLARYCSRTRTAPTHSRFTPQVNCSFLELACCPLLSSLQSECFPAAHGVRVWRFPGVETGVPGC